MSSFHVPSKGVSLGSYPLLPAQVYTKPADIASATDEQKAAVIGFTVGKAGFGEVAFDVPSFNSTDVRQIDLRYSLAWEGTPGRMTSVTLYPDDTTKPAQGVALNKPAIVSVYFEVVGWSMERIISIVEGQEDTRFVSYNRSTKLVRFQVNHFSTYGFKDEEAPPPQSRWNAPAPLSRRRLQAWSGGHCELEVDPCPRGENDCDALRAECIHVGAGTHECICHAGYESSDGGKSCTTIQ